MNSFLQRRGTNLLVLAAYIMLAALAWYYIFFAIHPIPYDMSETFLPWRFFVGEALQQHQLPLWDPYMQFGHPLGLDPSGSAWYPPVWFFGYLFGYDYTIISVEFVVHLIWAALGTYMLTRYYGASRYAAWFAGAAWMCSGVFVGNAQHMTWIVSAAWLPWSALCIAKALKDYSKRDAIAAGITIYMHLSGGYTAVVILLFYYTLAFSLVQMITTRKYRFQIRYLFLIGGVALLSSTIILAGVMYTWKEVMRNGSIEMSDIMANPFPLKALLTFTFPSVSVENPSYFDTDISMANGYLGIFFIFFFLASVMVWKNKSLWWYIAIALFCWLASLGEESFLREWLYLYIPGMDVFRHPSLFRIFTLLMLLVPAAKGFDYWLEGNMNARQFYIVWTGVTLLILISYIFIWNTLPAMYARISWQLGAHIVLLLAFWMFWKRREKINPQRYAWLILILVSLDLAVANTINIPWTAVDAAVSSSDKNQKLKALTPGLVLSNDTLVPSTYNPSSLFGWRNLNHYYHRVAYDGYNPYETKLQYQLEHSCVFDQIKNKPLVYFSDKVILLRDVDDCKLPEGAIFVTDVPALWHWYEDSLSIKDAELKKVTAQGNGLTITYDAVSPAVITVQQSYWPYWQATDEEGKPVVIQLSNYNTMSMRVDAGIHTIQLKFHPPGFTTIFWISFISLAWFIALILMANLRDWFFHLRDTLNTTVE